MVARQSPGGSTLERALRALEKMEAKLAAAEKVKSEPIAIVGLGCRFPGNARGPTAFWQVLHSGIDPVTEVSADRWGGSLSSPHPAARWAGLLDNIDQFDSSFFGIGRQDAADMDPQHRLLLEVAWETLEHGGFAPQRLAGTKTGVFVGIASREYLDLLVSSGAEMRPYMLSGNASSFAASRIAHLLGLHGPCLSIDTACSSALVALHVACQSLRRGECDLALVGGVNLLLSPDTSNLLGSLQILSSKGRCRTFDAQADGYVRAEGAGFVLLERLTDAQTHRDRVWALVRGSAVNQNGRAASLTAPSIQAQAAVIRGALQDARVAPEQVGYVEVHSNGSPMGDSVELEALRDVLGKPRKDESHCVLGSVKSCIGHAEAASGMASLIKAVLVLNNGVIPRNLHFESLNPNASIEGTPFVIPTHEMAWKKGAKTQLAGVSATGLSGTNAHIVIEEPPTIAHPVDKHERPVHLFVLSGKTSAALRDQAKQMLRHVTTHPELSLGDQCHTLGVGRAHFEYRFAAVVQSNAELAGQLTDFMDDAPSGYLTGRVQSLSARRRMAFLFTGNAADARGALGAIDAAPPALRNALQEADNAVFLLIGQQVASLLEEQGMQASGDEVAGELALFILQYALVELWRSWGFEPAVVGGEGTGECVAAWAAGVLEFADALKLAVARARWIHGRSRDSQTFARCLAVLKFAPPQRTFHPSLGGSFSSGSLGTLGYWEERMATPQGWDAILASMASQEYDACLELGPRPTIMGRSVASRNEMQVVPSLRPQITAYQALLHGLAQLYVSGFDIQWNRLDVLHPYRRIPMPTYPFQRERYWFGGRGALSTKPVVQDGHWLLGRVLEPRADRPDVRAWETVLDDSNTHWIGVQQVAGVTTVSSGAIAEFAGIAAREFFAKTPWELSLALGDPPGVDISGGSAIQVIGTPQSDSRVAIDVYFRVRSGAPWKRLANGIAQSSSPVEDIDEVAPPSIRGGRRESLPMALWGHRLEALGVQTDVFPVEQIWRRGGETLARVHLKGLQLARSVIRAAVAIASITHPGIYGRWWMIEAMEGFILKETVSEGPAWLRLNWNADDGYAACVGIELVDDEGSVVAAVRRMELRAQDPASLLRAMGHDPLEDVFIDLAWKEVPLPPRTAAKRKWVVLLDEGQVGSKLVEFLKGSGDTVFALRAADIEEHSDKLDMILLFSGPFSGVIHLGALDAGANGRFVSASLGRALSKDVETVMRIVRSMSGLVHVPRLWMVTRGAQGMDNPQPSLAQAGLWGLGRVLSTERPDMWGGMIDMDQHGGEDHIAYLGQMLQAFGPGTLAVKRGTKAYVARLARFAVPEERSLEMHADKTYLLTGAATPLGIECARWLVDRGAKHVVLAETKEGARAFATGVREATEPYASLVSIFQAKGVKALIFDVGEAGVEQLQASLARIQPPLGGIVHAAGAIEQRTLRLTATDAISKTSEAIVGKTTLLWALHKATMDVPLDFFVTFSSLTSAWGWESFGADAVVSDYADAIARARRAAGLPATAVHLAFPNQVPVGSSEQDHDRLAIGFQAMAAAALFTAVDRLIVSQKPVATIARVDWNLFESSGRAGMLQTLLEGLTDGRTARVGASMFQRRLAAADPEHAKRLIENLVRTEITQVLGRDIEISKTDDFTGLGMDSIMGVQVLTRIGRASGVNLPVSILLEHPSVDLLTRRILHHLRPDVGASDDDMASPMSRRGLLIEFSRKTTKNPFFLVPPLSGSGIIFQSIYQHLSSDRPLCTFSAPGMDSDGAPCERVEILARRFIEALRMRQPHGPYLLGGYSFGVLVAYEMAQILTCEGERVDTLVLLDLPPLTGAKGISPLSQLARLFKYSVDLANFDELGLEIQVEQMVRSTGNKLMLPPDLGESTRQLRVYGAHLRALQAYTLQPYTGSVTLIRSHETITNGSLVGLTSNDPSLGWNSLCSKPVRVYDLPGDHFNILLNPDLARLLETIWDEADLPDTAQINPNTR